MTVSFPSTVTARQITALQPIVTGGVLRSELTGAAQIRASARMRWSATFELPPLAGDNARLVMARLTQARRDTLAIPLSTNAIGGPGAVSGVTLSTAWSGGFACPMQGLPSDLTLREGWFFSILTAGRHYLYQISFDSVPAPGSTTSRLVAVAGVNHVVHAVDDPISFVPTLEGAVSWAGASIDVARLAGHSFTVEQL